MSPNPAPIKVGALLFPGFELLDVYGPLEMFGSLGERAWITMLAEQAGPIRSHQGPACVADAPLAGDHALDVLLVPGGIGTRRLVSSQPFLDELRRQCDKARFVATVCTGSGLLARTGALDGRSATSNKFAFKWAASQGPKVAASDLDGARATSSNARTGFRSRG